MELRETAAKKGKADVIARIRKELMEAFHAR